MSELLLEVPRGRPLLVYASHLSLATPSTLAANQIDSVFYQTP